MLRLGIFLIVLIIIAGTILFRSQLELRQAGYLGIVATSLLASSSMILPVPALATVCTASVFLVPLYVGLLAGTAETVGELTGYSLGYSGSGIVRAGRRIRRLEPWVQRRGWIPLFLLAVLPNPVFDLAGITAGALKYPLLRFLAIVMVGKTLKFVGFAYGCAASAEWLISLFRWAEP